MTSNFILSLSLSADREGLHGGLRGEPGRPRRPDRLRHQLPRRPSVADEPLVVVETADDKVRVFSQPLPE